MNTMTGIKNQATFQAQRVKIEHGRVAASARANSVPAARPAAYLLAVGGRRGSWALARPAPPGSWLPTLRTEAFKSSGAGAMRSRRAPLLALGPAPAFLPSAQDSGQLRFQMGLGAADIAEIIPEVREKLPGLKPPYDLEPEPPSGGGLLSRCGVIPAAPPFGDPGPVVP